MADHRVVVVAYDDLHTFDYGITTEIFAQDRPSAASGWYGFQTAAADDGQLTAHGGMKVAVDGHLELLADAQTIVVPGWRLPKHVIPQPFVDALRQAHRNGARVVALCGGAYALAEAGLLNGRRATAHWEDIADFTTRYPDVRFEPKVLYVDEGDVMTSAGRAAGIDLCLHIVRRDYGPEAANEVARGMVAPPHRNGGQAQLVRRPVPPDDKARMAPLLDWVRASLGEDLSLARLSEKVAMSHRTFIRQFIQVVGVPPGEWILGERLAHACDLLETTGLGIDDIAFRCGLGTAANLRHHFRHRYGTTPTSHRAQFARHPP